MEEEKIKQNIKNILSEKRYYHSICVAEQCEKLATQYNIDTSIARKIGLAHDIAKELTKEEKIKYALQNQLEINDVEEKNIGLLHGKIAADICKKEFGFTKEMCKAISCHTTGKENMTILDKILFVADAIGEDRQWQDVEDVRKLAKENINQAVIYILDMTIKEKIESKELIHTDSILARNSILKEIM